MLLIEAQDRNVWCGNVTERYNSQPLEDPVGLDRSYIYVQHTGRVSKLGLGDLQEPTCGTLDAVDEVSGGVCELVVNSN